MARRRARTQTERKQILDLILAPLHQLNTEIGKKESSKLPSPPKKDVEALERVVERLDGAGYDVSVGNRYGVCGPMIQVRLKDDHPSREAARAGVEAAKMEVFDAINDIRRAVLYSDDYDAGALDAQAREMAERLRRSLI